MSMILLYPPGRLYAQYRAAEDALDFLSKLHARQTALERAHPDYYDVDAHICVLAFNLRVVGRKIDALVSAFRAGIQPGQVGGVSQRTTQLQTALQEYNATIASVDPWDNLLHAAVNAVGLAYDYLRSAEQDIQLFEQKN